MKGEAYIWIKGASLAVAALYQAVSIYNFRHRPGAPPASPMIRWTVVCSIAAVVALIALMFWLAGRDPSLRPPAAQASRAPSPLTPAPPAPAPAARTSPASAPP